LVWILFPFSYEQALTYAACVAGASIICVDLIVQLIPRFRSFRIQDSNTFLSSSLSLSFGVMLYSALYSMLPSAKSYLVKGGFEPRAASYILIACFLGGVAGIQIFSRFLHHYIPSHVVDCEHSHEDMDEDGADHQHAQHEHQGHHEGSADNHFHDQVSENTPLLARQDYDSKPMANGMQSGPTQHLPVPGMQSSTDDNRGRRPSLQKRLTRQLTVLMGTTKAHCDQGGPCHGFTDPCGQECFKAISRSPTRAMTRHSISGPTRSWYSRRSTTGTLPQLDEEHSRSHNIEQGQVQRAQQIQGRLSLEPERGRQGSTTHSAVPRSESLSESYTSTNQGHHHHVASNAFLSIGLQTSIAIALHKLPEGFITYATNHANPKLGFAVFMALFIHNITEGFAMALPLYLAINSRAKAMIISAFLGGISQPLGAGIAALWLQTAQKHDMIPGEKVYGGMFAVTAGIMTSVALQLFAESLGLTHSKNLCIAFAFIGMGILGLSNALTA
jgi:ZIP family zinc transporter